MKQDKQDKKNKTHQWALVLSGGGAKGLAHIGVLKAFADRGFPEPSLVVGTSMGAIVGGLYACGISPQELTRLVLEDFDITAYLDSFVFKLNGPVGKVFQTGQILGNFATRRGADSGQGLLKLFEELTKGKTFAQTRIPFRCNAVDLVSGKELVFSSGSVARAIRASMSFPGFFEPLVEETQGAPPQCLVDGGLANNMPVYIARNAGFRRVLAVDVYHFKTVPASDLKTGPHIVYRSIEVVINLMERKAAAADLTLYTADQVSPFNFFRKKEVIQMGEQVVTAQEPQIQAFFSQKPLEMEEME
ncbi:MAG: patatin-like phospholipase family protein [Spirochaetaceae bacterium]|jgi:NTE family protein|nr:patatin-like phospholipase family protein [Spirochaetaceae bacterium]